MRMIRIFMLMLAAGSITFGQGGSKATGDETKVIALENLWNQMQMKHDAEAMGQMLDANFVLTDYDGTIMSKGEFLASVKDMSNVLTTEVSQDILRANRSNIMAGLRIPGSEAMDGGFA